MAQQTLYNGNRFAHQNLSISYANTYAGQLPTGQSGDMPRGCIKTANYDIASDGGIVQGNAIQILGRTVGYGTATGTIEIYVSEFDDWMRRISSNGQYPYTAVDVDYTFSYSINDIDVRQDIWQGARILKVGAASQSGNDAHTRSVDFNIAQLLSNGLYAFADPSNQ